MLNCTSMFAPLVQDLQSAVMRSECTRRSGASEATRQDILAILDREGPRRVREMCDELGLSRESIGNHMKAMERERPPRVRRLSMTDKSPQWDIVRAVPMEPIIDTQAVILAAILRSDGGASFVQIYNATGIQIPMIRLHCHALETAGQIKNVGTCYAPVWKCV